MIELEQTIIDIHSDTSLQILCYLPFDIVEYIKNMLALSPVPDFPNWACRTVNFSLTNIFWYQTL